LSIDDFFDESFKMIMLRDPQWVTSEGLDAFFGSPGDQLTDISDDYIRETQDLQRAILDILHAYERETLTPEQQISYDVYEWYLGDLIRQHEFMYHDYPVVHFLIGVQSDLINFFTDIQPVESKADAENYISRLSQVDEKFDGLIEGLKLREDAGVVAPRFIFQWSMGGVRNISNSSARFTPFYSAFEEKVIALDNVNDEEKQALLERAEDEIDQSVIPAFRALAETMEHLQSIAPTDDGVWQFSNGEAYYQYTLQHHTTTELTSEEIHNLGLAELERVQEEMRAAFREIGYPTEGVSLPQLFDRLEQESEFVRGSDVAERFESILDAAEADLGRAFDTTPEAELVVIGGPTGDYYISPSLDGSRPGAFYARISGSGQDYYAMPTLAYHEGVPGHHFQISLAQESDLPLFRNAVGFTGYAEGWALYAERLAWDLGWYDDDPHGNLGRLQMEAFRAARLVIDTGIHTKGWTFDQALDFFVENVGFNSGDNVSSDFEISRYISWPGQATSYMVGMLKILELRQRAIDTLGGNFDLAEFHDVVLSNGSMPLQVLEDVVDQYIAAKQEEVSAATEAFLSDLEKTGGVIVFSSYRNGESSIFTMNPDGSNLTQLTNNDYRNSRPDWSFSGDQIAYVSRVGSRYNYDLYSMNADGSRVMRVNRNPESFESEPAWSPDGTQLAFISNRQITENTFDGRFNIFVVDTESDDQRLLTDFGGSNSSPDWSPDGSQIAFQSTVDENLEIYTISPDGSNLINLTNNPASDYTPAWSPDGSKIAFVSDRNGNEDIFVMDADGSNVIQLTTTPSYDKGPAWSPDGKFLVYYANWGLNNEVYVIRADGSAIYQITYHGNFDGFPDWQPNPNVEVSIPAPEAVAEVGVSQTAEADSLDPSPKVDELVAGLADLELAEFFDQSFELILHRDPEGITSLGLADYLGVRNDQLTNISNSYVQQNNELYAEILVFLNTFDRDSLTPEEQISFDVYAWYLDDLLRQSEFMLYDYPVSHFFVTSVPDQILDLFSELHPISDGNDVEDYIGRLSQIDSKFDQLIEGLELRAQAGIVVPRFSLRQARGSVSEIANSSPEFTPYYRILKEKMSPLSNITPDEQAAFLDLAKVEIENSVIPAYQKLAEYLTELEADAPSEIGVGQYDQGDAYYQYILRHHTTTDLTPEEVHDLGFQELARVQAEMREIFAELGYPEGESLSQSFNRVASESGSLRGPQILDEYESILDEAEANLETAFDLQPSAELVIIGGPTGGYYMSPALDGSRPGAFHAATSGSEPIYKMATLAYHEGLPGGGLPVKCCQF